MARYFLILACVLTVTLGCVDSDVSASETEKNLKEFSQDSYDQAMIKAGKGKELEEEKKRNAAHMAGQQSEGQQ